MDKRESLTKKEAHKLSKDNVSNYQKEINEKINIYTISYINTFDELILQACKRGETKIKHETCNDLIQNSEDYYYCLPKALYNVKKYYQQLGYEVKICRIGFTRLYQRVIIKW